MTCAERSSFFIQDGLNKMIKCRNSYSYLFKILRGYKPFNLLSAGQWQNWTNGLLVYLQHGPKILLRNLDLFISTLLSSSLTFCYILVTPDRRLPTGKVWKCQWLQCRETSSAPDRDGGRMSATQRRRALSVFPELKVANFALLLSVSGTVNRIR